MDVAHKTTGSLASIDVTSRSDLLFENLRWLNTQEAASYLRTTPKQLRKWVYQGKVKAYKLLTKSLRFDRDELDLLIKGGLKWR